MYLITCNKLLEIHRTVDLPCVVLVLLSRPRPPGSTIQPLQPCHECSGSRPYDLVTARPRETSVEADTLAACQAADWIT